MPYCITGTLADTGAVVGRIVPVERAHLLPRANMN